MDQNWDRIEQWLEENAAETLDMLAPGAEEDEIVDAEEALGLSFPDDLRQSYLRHNGEGDDEVYLAQGWILMSLDAVVDNYKMLQKLYEDGVFDPNDGLPEGPVKPVWWSPKWIPVAENGGGDYLMIDLDPAEGGKVGQVVEYWHNDDLRTVMAPSFAAFMAKMADDLEAGKYSAGEWGELAPVEA